jgi:chemotaxis protein MotB
MLKGKPKGRKKRAEEPEKENSERWLLTYADMITLLMLFFIVLYSMSNINKQKFEEIAESLRLAFTGGTMGIFSNKGTSPVQFQSTTPKILESVKQQRKGKTWLIQQAKSKLQPLIRKGELKVMETERGITFTIFSDFQFKSGSAELEQDQYQILRDVGDFLLESDYPLVVEGHTDSAPIEGSGRYHSNWELSAARATVVVSTLEEYGVPGKRMSASAFGSTKPVTTNDTPEGRAYNRRIEVTLITSD